MTPIRVSQECQMVSRLERCQIQYVVFAHWMLCCSVAIWKGGGLNCRNRLNSSDNYLLPGFLLVSPHNLCSYWSVIQDNLSISVSYPSSSNVKCWTNLLTLETKMTPFKRGELGQQIWQSKIEFLPFSVNYESAWRLSKKCNQTNEHQIFNPEENPDYVSCFLQLGGWTRF